MKKVLVFAAIMLCANAQSINGQSKNFLYYIVKITSVIWKASSADDFNEGFLNICIDGKWAYINYKGEVITSFEYDIAKPFNCEMENVEKDNYQYGFVYEK